MIQSKISILVAGMVCVLLGGLSLEAGVVLAPKLTRPANVSFDAFRILNQKPLKFSKPSKKKSSAKQVQLAKKLKKSEFAVEKSNAMPHRVLVEFNENLSATASSIHRYGRRFKDYSALKSDSLERLSDRIRIKKITPVFRKEQEEKDIDEGRPTSIRLAKERGLNKLRELRSKSKARSLPKEIPDLSGMYLIEYESDFTPEAVVQLLLADPHIKAAQPDYVVTTNQVAPPTNDPFFNGQKIDPWQNYDTQWGLKSSKFPEAWSLSEGEGVLVGVVDSGIDYRQLDFGGNVLPPPGGFRDTDVAGHGTAVASVVAAIRNNSMGIAGAAPRSKVMPFTVLDASDGLISVYAWAAGINEAVSAGAKVINSSIACYSYCPSNFPVEAAVSAAISAGVTVVLGAGNSTIDVGIISPQNMTNPKPIVVGSSGKFGQRSSFSNFGPQVDLYAPGEDIAVIKSPLLSNATGARYSWCLQDPTSPGGCREAYATVFGSSFSAPFVSSAAALLISAHPDWTPEQIRQVLKATTETNTFLPPSQLLNAYQALRTSSLQVAITSPTEGQIFENELIDIRGTIDGMITSYDLSYADATASIPVWMSLASGTSAFQDTSIAQWWPNGVPHGQYKFRLSATSVLGTTFTTERNFILEHKATPFMVQPGEQSHLEVSENKAIWQDSRSGNFDIRLYDFTSAQERLITASQPGGSESRAGDQGHPVINSRYIAWIASDGTSDFIEISDRATGIETRLTPSSARRSNLLISEASIAWAEQASPQSSFEIVVDDFNLATPPLRLPSEGADTIPFALDSHSIAFGRYAGEFQGGGAAFHLYSQDLSSPSPVDLGLWDMLLPTRGIFLNDLIVMNPDGMLFGIPPDGDFNRVLEFGINEVVTGFDIQGKSLVWTDSSNGNGDLYFKSLITGRVTRLTFDRFNHTNPRLIGPTQNFWKVIWQDGRNGNSDLYSLELNRPPYIASPGAQTVEVAQPLSFTLHSLDYDGGVSVYSLDNPPDGADFNSQTHDFSWTPTATQQGQYQLHFIVDDGFQGAEIYVPVTVTPKNFPPVLSVSNLSVSMDEGTSTTVQYSASDPNSDPLTYSVTDLPSFASLNAASRTITLAPGFDIASASQPTVSFSFNIQVSDGSLSDSKTVQVSVREKNRAPVLDPVPPLVAYAGEAFSLTLHATDPDGDSIASYDFLVKTSLIGGTTLYSSLGNVSGSFSWTPSSLQAGTYVVILRAKDSRGLSSGNLTVPLTIFPPRADLLGQYFFPLPILAPETINSSVFHEYQNTLVYFMVKLKNGGNSATGAFHLAFYVNGVLISEDTEVSMQPGEEKFHRSMRGYQARQLGNFPARIEIDNTNVVVESNEANNRRDLSLIIQAAPPPAGGPYGGS